MFLTSGYMLSLLGVFLIWFINYAVILPLWRIHYYRKHGIPGEYFPILGAYAKAFKNFGKTGDFYKRWKETAKREPRPKALCTNLMSEVELALFDPLLIKDFLGHPDHYVKHPLINIFKLLLGNGIFTAEGHQWKTHRKLVSLNFHYEYLHSYVPEIVHIAREMLEKQKKKDLKNVNIMEVFQNITGETVGRLFFGDEFGGYSIQGRPAIEFIADLITRIGQESFGPLYLAFGVELIKAGILPRHKKLMEDIRVFRDFCRGILNQRMKEISEETKKGETKKRKDMLEHFYDQRLQHPAESLSDEEIIDEVATFFIAGMDTTGHLTTMASYFLTKNPEHKQKLSDEIDIYFKDYSRVDLDDLNKMDFMTAFLKESLRMATPAPMIFNRVALVDHMIGHLRVKKGTQITTSFIANNFDERFHNDPETFLPNRWLEQSKTLQSVTANPFVFTPFSAGGRNCIGQHLAMAEAKIILSTFLKTFDFELSEKGYEARLIQNFMYEPSKPIKYNLTVK